MPAQAGNRGPPTVLNLALCALAMSVMVVSLRQFDREELLVALLRFWLLDFSLPFTLPLTVLGCAGDPGTPPRAGVAEAELPSRGQRWNLVLHGELILT